MPLTPLNSPDLPNDSIHPDKNLRSSGKTAESRRLRKKKLAFARPDITRAEIESVEKVLLSGWLTSGPETEAFEKEFAAVVHSPHAVAVNSATAALHLALAVRDIGPGDAVIVPAITFTATAEAVMYTGATPLIVDVARDSYLLEADLLREYIDRECIKQRNGTLQHRPTGKIVRAMMPVHLGGRTCDMRALAKLAREYDMFTVEDAAHAFPTESEDGRTVGSIGPMTAFSFYATKNLSTGEGGMLTVKNARLADRLRRMRLHGIKGQTYGRKRWRYDVVEKGFKYNMNDMAAAMGRVQLCRSEEMLIKRQRIDTLYRDALLDIPGLRLPPDVKGSSCHLFTIEVERNARVGRDRLVEEMYARNISLSLHFIPLYRHSFYRRTFGLKKSSFPHSEQIYRNMASLPLYSAMSEDDALDVIAAMRETLV